MHNEDTANSANPIWEAALLESSDGPQDALRLNDPNREVGIPEVYRLLAPHPLRPKGFTRANYTRCKGGPFHDYVLPIRKTSEFMEVWQQVGAEITTPTDDVSVIEKQGWLQLKEGDMVWVRDLEGTKHPEDDVIRFYYISSGIMEPKDKEELEQLAEDVLGGKELRTAKRPSLGEDGTYSGGTAFERSNRANGVKGARCYTTAFSYQDATKIASPTQGSKSIGSMDENLLLRREVNLVVPTIAAELCWKTAPRNFCEVLDEYGDLLNIPSVGKSFQHFYSNVQVNISPAASGSDDLATFQVSLGQFAAAHYDRKDAAAALTAMGLVPSVPKGYRHGIFAYHDFKMFIQPTEPSFVYFTGLHRHGGTAPSPPEGEKTQPWAYRLAVICYPNGHTMQGESRNALVPFSGFDIVVREEPQGGGNDRKDVLKIPPELRWRERPNCDRANLARDGPILQGPQAFITSITRELELFIDHCLSFPRDKYPEYDLRVDFDQIRRAITLTPKGNQSGAALGRDDDDTEGVIRPLPWRNAPKPDGSTDEFNERMKRCQEYMHRFAMHTPFHYLAFEKRANGKGCEGKATRVQRSGRGVKAVNNNAGRKRKAQDAEDEDQEDECRGAATAGSATPPLKKRTRSDQSRLSTPIPTISGVNLTTDFKISTELNHSVISGEVDVLRKHIGAKLQEAPSNKSLLDSITSIPLGKPETTELPSHWRILVKVDKHTEVHSVDARVLGALSLEAHAQLWSWFSEQVTKPAQILEKLSIGSLGAGLMPSMPNLWIGELVLAVKMQLLLPTVSLEAKRFFPDLVAPDYMKGVRTYPKSKKVLDHVEAAVAFWLLFDSRPGMSLSTSRAVATFISIACEAFGSPNFLYLNYVQQGIKKLRVLLTHEGIELADIHWEKLAKELKNHPLAHSNSNERLALNHLRDLLWTFSSFQDPRPVTNMSIFCDKAVALGRDEGVQASMGLTGPSLQITSEPGTPAMSPLTPISSPIHHVSQRGIDVSRFFSFLRATFPVAPKGTTPHTVTQHATADMLKPSEVGEIIFKINTGARAGLKLLRYDVESEESCAEAMGSLWREITESFTVEEINEMGLDLITLEHALCKLEQLESTIEDDEIY